jgi:nitrite reductase/ring-hydroxylating ferredoxin subunit
MKPVTTSDGTRICLVNVDGAIHAVSDVCTHQEFAMSDGALLPGGVIECAWHGAQFDCRTGKVKRYPATEPLPVYEVTVEDGMIYLAGRTQ